MHDFNRSEYLKQKYPADSSLVKILLSTLIQKNPKKYFPCIFNTIIFSILKIKSSTRH